MNLTKIEEQLRARVSAKVKQAQTYSNKAKGMAAINQAAKRLEAIKPNAQDLLSLIETELNVILIEMGITNLTEEDAQSIRSQLGPVVIELMAKHLKI